MYTERIHSDNIQTVRSQQMIFIEADYYYHYNFDK